MEIRMDLRIFDIPISICIVLSAKCSSASLAMDFMMQEDWTVVYITN